MSGSYENFLHYYLSMHCRITATEESTICLAIATFWHTFHHDGKFSLVRVWGARFPPLTLFTITSNVVAYALAERAGTLPLFLLYPYMYSVVYHCRITAKT
jgi:hypothetical protein